MGQNKLIPAMTALFLTVAVSAAMTVQGESVEASGGPSLLARYEGIDKSSEGLQEYRAIAIRDHRRIVELREAPLLATITFSHLIGPDEALELIEQHRIRPRLIYYFGRLPDGTIMTGATRLTENLRKTIDTTLGADEGQSLGVGSIVGLLPASRIGALQVEPRVFLVDISADKRLGRNPGNEDYMHHLSWDLLRLEGLVE